MTFQNDSEGTPNELVSRAAAGDDIAMAELIEIITPIAYAKASNLNSGFSRIADEDLVQEGMLGFLEAVKSFDGSKGVPFEAYAATCIKNRILSALRVNSNSGNAALSGAVSIDDNSDNKAAGDSDPVVVTEDGEESDYIRRLASDSLSDFESKVFFLKLGGHSYKDIAFRLGRSEKSVDNALVRIRGKLRKIL